MAVLFITACQQKEILQEITKETPELKACSKEAKICPNGRTVSRNPEINCEFNSCDRKKAKVEPIMCTADVKECPDGSYVGRDHYNNCKFRECPPTKNGRDIE